MANASHFVLLLPVVVVVIAIVIGVEHFVVVWETRGKNKRPSKRWRLETPKPMPRLGVTRARKRETVSSSTETRRRRKSERERKGSFYLILCRFSQKERKNMF